MMTLTRYGFKEWGSAILVAVVLWGGCFWLIRYTRHCAAGWIAASAVAVILVAFCAFFRNPHREIPAELEFVVSPADGTVRDIEYLENFDFFPPGVRTVRIGIFLSVLNVHVNRMPVTTAVDNIHYRKGEFLDARHPEAGRRNEAMTVSGKMTGVEDFPVAVRQISGAIARRIVCPVAPGKIYKKGYVYGMIKFGSRTELYLPADKVDVKVSVGDKVFGGTTVVAEIKGVQK
ncbi:MAG: phosphatidylserine decarboxylase [Victivallaceae bacterium]|nr:phosphatidylserine decarboxylase [Victivallaceae bacterium]